MSDLGRCKHTLYILKHKPAYKKAGAGGVDIVVDLIKTSERRQSIRSVRGGAEHGNRIIKAGIYPMYHSGSGIIGSRYPLV